MRLTLWLPVAGGVRARLRNEQTNSSAFGLVKELHLSSYQDHTLQVEYSLPETLRSLDVEFGLSPDYLRLLRRGRSLLKSHERRGAHGWRTDSVAVWVKPAHRVASRWTTPYQREFGHGCALRLSFDGRQFGVVIGVDRMLRAARIETTWAICVEENA
jgi:hypothetical protein